MNMKQCERSTLAVEKLEQRELLAVSVTAVVMPQLDSETAFIATTPTGGSEIVVFGKLADVNLSFIGRARLTKDGELPDTIDLEPAASQASLYGNAEASVGAASAALTPGSTADGKAAYFSSVDGAISQLFSDFPGEIVVSIKSPQQIGLLNKTDGSQTLLIGNNTVLDIPSNIEINAMSQPNNSETILYLGGTNKTTGNATVLPYHLALGAFLDTVDFAPAPGTSGTIKGFSRAIDNSGELIADVEVTGLLPGGVPALGNFRLNNPSAAEFFAPSSFDKVLTEAGTTVYQRDGEWFAYFSAKTAGNLIGAPQSVEIPVANLLAQAGFTDTTVIDITRVMSDGFNHTYIVSDIEVQGFSMTSIISIYDSAPLLNKSNNVDVNEDGLITPIDALLVINRLNSRGSSIYSLGDVAPLNYASPSVHLHYLDTNGDGFISPIDALLVINYLNSHSPGNGEGEGATIESIADKFDVEHDYARALVGNSALMAYFEERKIKRGEPSSL